MRKPLVLLFFVLLLFTACRQNPSRHTVINRISFASNYGYKDSLPTMRIEIDSALNYEFYGGYGCTMRGYYEGKTTKGFWDTLTGYLSAYIDSLKRIPPLKNNEQGPRITICYPPPRIKPTEMLVHYDSSKTITLNCNKNFSKQLLNSYKSVDLKMLGADATYSFDIHIAQSDSNNIPSTADIMPTLATGNINDYLASHITYPPTMQEKTIEGTVYATFIVEKDGSLSDIHIIKGVTNGQELDKSVLDVLNIMPKWKPGITDGKPVRVRYTLPVKFMLTN